VKGVGQHIKWSPFSWNATVNWHEMASRGKLGFHVSERERHNNATRLWDQSHVAASLKNLRCKNIYRATNIFSEGQSHQRWAEKRHFGDYFSAQLWREREFIRRETIRTWECMKKKVLRKKRRHKRDDSAEDTEKLLREKHDLLSKKRQNKSNQINGRCSSQSRN
jgi:hypothetical protein